ncbi:c-type cytochrome domain-containing protein [Flavihumibacter profundi]|uniref:c-type cytochrome domain-containing protein n=1 Tax=Flavihumibacter profundi TaxID=2716883 RepID=UPI001CC6AE68|nr:c-type cytochrome domain-containing protein [Flavihumibacter profundi]MBZ5855976.1 hypothetical protein [Flavihumibacter profundi]
MMLLSVADLIGRFHPILVHLPIGILLLACILNWLSGNEKYAGIKPAISLAILLGMIGAIFSCISGYFLSQSADYSEDLVWNHQWLGIITAIVSITWYYLYHNSASKPILKWSSVAIFILVTITGHLGGSLTHGEDYLTEMLSSPSKAGPVLAAMPNAPDAILYKDVINPIFEARCYSCHGANKQKGKLRLDSPAFIKRGGEDGEVVVAGKPEESELIKRLLLSLDAKKHMPPRNKSQLTEKEISLLHWWISTGMDVTKKIKEIDQPENIKPVLAALQKGTLDEKTIPVTDLPAETVKPADMAVIGQLQKAGIVVIPVARESNYLSVNFVSALSVNDSLFGLLASIKDQLAWLKMDGVPLSDAAISSLTSCTKQTRLQISNTSLNDAQLARFSKLLNLQSLNLVGTKITTKGLLQLKGLAHLKNVYVYKTGITSADWLVIKQNLKGVSIDSGNYSVPMLVGDTTLVKAPK